MIKINRGLDLPIEGSPSQSIVPCADVRSVAVIGFDFIGMKPTMHVQQGDRVKLGQVLFVDKKTPGVKYTAPAAGVVSMINRGEKRVLQSVVIDIDNEETGNIISFASYSSEQLSNLEPSLVREQLIDSGSWPAFRSRPFSKVPAIDTVPNAIFVTAMDTNPLAADPAPIIAANSQAFEAGLTVLTRLGAETVFCCAEASSSVSVGNSVAELALFSGPHPAGVAGTHIHHLAPASMSRTAWTINYQEVIAIGNLFTSGQLDVTRTVALGGPLVREPALVTTRLGASLDELTAGRLEGNDIRIISGSVFNGRKASGPYSYLGRYHLQISVLEEGRDREFMSYLRAGFNKHSVTGTFISAFKASRLFPFTTTTNGSDRAMVPIGSYEKVMPLDILPTQLLRALIVGDSVSAQQLGCLELDEEDLALCTYVCPGKYEYGTILRDNLERIEKEG